MPRKESSNGLFTVQKVDSKCKLSGKIITPRMQGDELPFQEMSSSVEQYG